MTKPIIYFDMDGTIADFYRGDWLDKILASDTTPYDTAPALVSPAKMAWLAKHYDLGIISWLPRGGSKEYSKAVRKSKKEWLKANYPDIEFSEVHIVKYGTPKWKVARCPQGILVDDEKRNRRSWKGLAIIPWVVRFF